MKKAFDMEVIGIGIIQMQKMSRNESSILLTGKNGHPDGVDYDRKQVSS